MTLGCTVGELQERMSYREFKRWVWLFEEQPFGEYAMDLRFHDLITIYGNANRKKNKKAAPLRYFVKKRRRQLGQTAEQAAAALRAFGGRAKR